MKIDLVAAEVAAVNLMVVVMVVVVVVLLLRARGGSGNSGICSSSAHFEDANRAIRRA